MNAEKKNCYLFDFLKFHILLRRLNGQITHQICRKLLDILLLAINHSSVKKKFKYFSFEIWTSLYMYTALYQKEKSIALNDCNDFTTFVNKLLTWQFNFRQHQQQKQRQQQLVTPIQVFMYYLERHFKIIIYRKTKQSKWMLMNVKYNLHYFVKLMCWFVDQ